MTLILTPDGIRGAQGQAMGSAVDFAAAEYEEYLELTRGQYFLLRLKGVDLASHCKRCNAGKYPIPAHTYFTLMCVERPWRGDWTSALYAYSTVTRDPHQRQVLLRGLGYLEQSHPETASKLLLPGDAQNTLVFAISALEPIDKWKADTLVQSINDIGSMGYNWKPLVL